VKKVVYFVLDGLADLPIDNQTPLSAASKPNLDWLAKNGAVGEMAVIPNKIWTNEMYGSVSHLASISLLGYPLKKFLQQKRGPLEAVGAGIPYQEGHLALRCNFATVDKDLRVVDRRAGRNFYGLSELARHINEHVNIGVPFTFMRTFEHRAVLIIKMNLSDDITGNDPFVKGEKVKKVSGLSSEGMISAKIVQNFIDKAHEAIAYHAVNAQRIDKKLLPANYILVREAGNKLFDLLPHFQKKWKVKKPICIAEPGVFKAACLLAGFEAITVPEADFEDALDFIFENVNIALADHDFVFVHIKGPIDEAAHDGDFERKRKAIEAVDERFANFKKFDGRLVVTCDHITSTEKQKHMPGKVPVLVYGKAKDKVSTFNEFEAKKGKLKNYTPQKLLKYVLR
jgi:2,3-bisphosphoglycerate-independent phosphoglycerate mutase